LYISVCGIYGEREKERERERENERDRQRERERASEREREREREKEYRCMNGLVEVEVNMVETIELLFVSAHRRLPRH